MKRGYRPAVFVVVFSKYNNKIKYLLLKRKLHWHGWEFPKGGIEKAESKLEASKRECKEETGHKPLRIIKFNKKGKYNYYKLLKDRPKYKGQTYTLFAAQIPFKKAKIDKKEHSSYAWFDFKTAYKKLKWPNQKKSLKIVNRYII